MTQTKEKAKGCSKCGQVKPLTEFYVRPRKKTRRRAKCISCYKEYDAMRYERDHEDLLVSYREYYQNNKEDVLKRHSEYSKSGRKKSKVDKYKNRARTKLRYEVKMGRIKRGVCEKCGDPNTDAHHEDYTKPLDVRWLCRKHHMEQHRIYKPTD